MNAELRGRKGLERSRDFHIWKVLGGGGALRGLKRLTYDSVVYFYFRYPLQLRHLKIPQNVRHCKALASGARHCHLISVEQTIFRLFQNGILFSH